jgi:transcriptional regulator with XRE-family HTH domain
MVRGRDPLFQKRRLRGELRRLRGEASLTQREVAEALHWSPSKVIRIETGATGISVTDLRALLARYGVSDPAYIEDLETAALDSRRSPWWQEYEDVLDPQYQALLGFESAAIIIREFNPLLIPGLLQTREYAEAYFKELGVDLAVDARTIEARLEHQKLLEEDDRPEMFFILDEAAIRRRIGGSTVMADQLRHLVELAQRPRISIQVIDFGAGAHSGLAGPFIVFELSSYQGDSGGDEYIVFLETAGPDYLIRDSPEQSSTYVERFLKLEQVAHSTEDTIAIINETIEQILQGGRRA